MYDGEMYSTIKWSKWKSSIVKKWNKKADKDSHLKNIRVHDLRDSHGMWLLSKGVDIKTIQKRLRHAKATTTMNYYLDKLPDSEDKVLQDY
jgi:integrase